MSSEGLEVRARVSQEFLGFLDEYRPGLREALTAKVSAHYLDTLAHAPPNAWLPFAISAEGVEAAIEILGDDFASDLWRRAFVARFVKTPIVGGLVNSWVRLFGLSPATLIKVVPRAMQGTYKNLGDFEIVRVDTNSAMFRIHRFSTELLAHERYFLAWVGTLQGVLDMANATGSVGLTLDRPERLATFHVDW